MSVLRETEGGEEIGKKGVDWEWMGSEEKRGKKGVQV